MVYNVIIGSKERRGMTIPPLYKVGGRKPVALSHEKTAS